MQARLQICPKLMRGLPVLPHQRLEDRARATALAMDQDLVGELSQTVGHQPFEIDATFRPSQPDRQVFHLAVPHLRFDPLFADRFELR